MKLKIKKLDKEAKIPTYGTEYSAGADLCALLDGPKNIEPHKTEILNTGILDEVITVDESSAFETSRMLARVEGILAGISSGAALYAGIEVARREENRGKTVVVLLPDTGERYLSSGLFDK